MERRDDHDTAVRTFVVLIAAGLAVRIILIATTLGSSLREISLSALPGAPLLSLASEDTLPAPVC